MKKNLFLAFLLAVTATINVYAQNSSVTPRESLMSLGSRPGYDIVFHNTNEKTVEKLWKDFVKEQFGAKVKENKKTKESMGAGSSAAVGSGSFDVYSKSETKGKDVLLSVWFDLRSSFLNSKEHGAAHTDMINILKQFGYTVERDVVNDEIKVEEKKLKDREKDLARLQKDNQKLKDDIEMYKAKIKKAEEDIVKNEADQVTTQKDIEMQGKLLEEVRVKLSNIGTKI